MRLKTTRTVLRCVLVALLGHLTLAVTGAQPPEIERAVFAGGGGRATAGDVLLLGTIGQPIVGTVAAGDVEVDAGFWPAAVTTGPAGDLIFFDGFESGAVESWELP